jgi:hypothetical protein
LKADELSVTNMKFQPRAALSDTACHCSICKWLARGHTKPGDNSLEENNK